MNFIKALILGLLALVSTAALAGFQERTDNPVQLGQRVDIQNFSCVLKAQFDFGVRSEEELVRRGNVACTYAYFSTLADGDFTGAWLDGKTNIVDCFMCKIK